jgi:hypothetical protein
MPCQPTVLTGDKILKQIWACNSIFTQIRRIVNRHVRPSDHSSRPYRTSLPPMSIIYDNPNFELNTYIDIETCAHIYIYIYIFIMYKCMNLRVSINT